MRKLAAMILLLIFVGCPQQTIQPSPRIPLDTDWCKPGCEALLKLPGRDGNPGCEEARPIEMPNGEIVTCEQFCIDTQNAGRNLYPSCFSRVKICDEIEEYRKQPAPCESK